MQEIITKDDKKYVNDISMEQTHDNTNFMECVMNQPHDEYKCKDWNN